MKLKIIIIVIIASLLFPFASHAWNEPDNFMGIKFWHEIEESIKRCESQRSWEGANGAPCFLPYEAERGVYDIRAIAPTGLNFRYIKAHTISKKFAMLDLESSQEFFSQTFVIFQERYGKLTRITTETWTSQAGISVPNQVVLWEGKRISIVIQQRGASADWSQVVYDTDLWRANSGRLLNESIKKAAKGL